MSPTTLEQTLSELTAPGELYERLDGDALRCTACGHECKIRPGRAGVCKIRFNRDGVLFVPRGYVGGLAVDPIEKKPFFHAQPGARALSFGMLGCDYRCPYCQNWITSQTLRDPEAISPPREISAERIVDLAVQSSCTVVTSTYNEPLITSEWAVEIFRLARERGLATSYVSNGNGTPEVLEYLRPWVDYYKVDLKGFDERKYRRLGGRLGVVLDTIRRVHDLGMWLEIVTLVVPGFNDSDDELRRMAEFVASVSPEVPWHVTAFHTDYKMSDTRSTTVETVLRAARIGREAGLRFVYPGNLPGLVGDGENTICPDCGETLVRRTGFRVLENRIRDGRCPGCATEIPGRWKATAPA
jgi:pyruvate formate lyase activating enzyme